MTVDHELLVPFRKIDRWGYASSDGRVVIACDFDHAYPFHGIDAAHVVRDGKSGLMGRGGELVLPIEYDWIGDEDEGSLLTPERLLVLRKGERFGVASSAGEVLIPVTEADPDAALASARLQLLDRGALPPGAPRPVASSIAARYESTEAYENGRAIVRRGGLAGYVDDAGREVIAPTFEQAYDFDASGAAPVQRNGRFGHIDRDGNVVTPFEFDDCYSFVNGTAIVARCGRYGLVHRDGRVAVPCEYSELNDVHDGLAVAGKDGRFGYIDAEGHAVLPLEYDSVERIRCGLGRIAKDGKWGLVDSNGSPVVPLTCDPPDWDSGTFPETAEDRHPILREGGWGFVDSHGTQAVACRFRWAWGYRDGIARVAVADPRGEALRMPSGLASALHLFGWIHRDGSEAVALRYSLARDFEHGVARVQSAETTQVGYIDKAGNEYWED